MMERADALKFTPADNQGESQDPRQRQIDSILPEAMRLFPNIPFLNGLKSLLAVSKDAGTVVSISKAAQRYLEQSVALGDIDKKIYGSQIIEFTSFLESLDENLLKKT